MKPVIALIGRPNVGKSTLFNRLTRSRNALVADLPGLTRDRHYGEGRIGSRPYLAIDTGGFEPTNQPGILGEMAKQTRQAAAEADLIMLLVDARQGLTAQDEIIVKALRKIGHKIVLVINKAEGMQYTAIAADFYALGLGSPHIISAAHGDGVYDLIESALQTIYASRCAAAQAAPATEVAKRLKIAIVGRPNVGKSTLVNALLGEERVIAFDQPGTTRDSIDIDFKRGGQDYTLIDTAGWRRRGKVFETVEKFSIIKTLQSITKANVVVLLLDAQQDIGEQDAHIAGFIAEGGRALVVSVNKWDGLDAYQRTQIKRELQRKLNFLGFANFHFISALKRTGINALMRSVDAAYTAAMAKLPTPKLTRALQQAVAFQSPHRKGSVQPKLRYAHQGGSNPPVIVIHGNALEAVSDAYRRYLEGRFRGTFKLTGTPLRLEFRTGKNPFAKTVKRAS